MALDQLPVYTENSREYTVIKTDTFGPVVQMEVGAMLVGRIVNYKEAGMVFRFDLRMRHPALLDLFLNISMTAVV